MPAEYRLLGRLETGELAELYRAARGSEATAVIKLFHPRTSDKDYAKSVAETARRLAVVTHPGIAHVVELGLVKNRLAVVRIDAGRFTLGTALQRLATKEVLLAPALALTWVIELLELVHQAHEVGVVHGALTPGNVLLSPEGRPAVCDFGALLALESSASLKKNFGSRGRNNYRAPEAVSSDTVSVQSDLYSLGAITYELLTLREPSSGVATMSTRRENVPAPSRLDRRINSRLDPIILRALEPTPGRRYKSAADFAQALRDFLSQNGGLPSKDDLRRFVDELFPKEVNADAMGPVPFAEQFTLKEVGGAELGEVDDRSMVVMARKAFALGEVDATAETSDGLPAFPEFKGEAPSSRAGDRRDTEEIPPAPDRSELSWDAPPSDAPVARKVGVAVQANNAALKKRVRVVEDFEGLDTTRQPAVPSANDTIPMPTSQSKAKLPPVEDPGYAMTPAESQQSGPLVQDADGKMRRMITEERNLEAIRKQRAKMLALAGMFLFVGLAILGAVVWLRAHGLLPGSTPPPKVVVRPDPPLLPPVVVRPKPVEAVKPPPPPPKPDCYDAPPVKGAALLTVVSKRSVRVDLDGERLCSVEKVAVKPGEHKVVVTDLKTGLKEEHKLLFVAGRNAKLEAFIKGAR